MSDRGPAQNSPSRSPGKGARAGPTSLPTQRGYSDDGPGNVLADAVADPLPGLWHVMVTDRCESKTSTSGTSKSPYGGCPCTGPSTTTEQGSMCRCART